MSVSPLYAAGLGETGFILLEAPFRIGLESQGSVSHLGFPTLVLRKDMETLSLSTSDWKVVSFGFTQGGLSKPGGVSLTLAAGPAKLGLTINPAGGLGLTVHPVLEIEDEGWNIAAFTAFETDLSKSRFIPTDEALVYDTGYQSWSFSGFRHLYGPSLKPGARLAKDASYNAAATYTGGIGEHTLHWAGAWGGPGREEWLFLGAAGAREAISTVYVNATGAGVHARLDMDMDHLAIHPGQSLRLDPFFLGLSRELSALLTLYAEITSAEMDARVHGAPPSGVCTWYEFFTGVREKDMKDAIRIMSERAKACPVDTLLLDDGWQHDIGDWAITNKKFRESLRPLTDEAREAGFDSGLWFAPFYVRPTSKTVRRHPEWLLRNEEGKPVRAGVNPGWGGLVWALDPSHPGVVNYLREVTQKLAHEWNFDLLKLDFCFAGFLPGVRHDQSRTRARSAREALMAIRETAGDEVFMLGCGMPILPAVGIFDGMRVGPDTAPYWEIPLVHYFTQGAEPSARYALLTPIARQWQHGRWWWNDPDCLVLRRHGSTISGRKRRTLLRVIAMTGGMRLLGDAPAKLEEEGWQWLSRCLGPWPWQPEVADTGATPLPQVIVAHLPEDRMQRHLVLAVNLDTKSQDIPWPSKIRNATGPWLVLDIDRSQTWVQEGLDVIGKLPAGSHHLCLIMPLPDTPCVVGATWGDEAGFGLIQDTSLTLDETAGTGRLTVTLGNAPVNKGDLHFYVPPGMTIKDPPPNLSNAGMTVRIPLGPDSPTTLSMEFSLTP